MINRYVQLTVNRNRPSLPSDAFGSALLLYQVDPSVQPERRKVYSSAKEVSASNLPQRVKDALSAFFGAQNKPQSVALGRRNPGTAQVATVTVTTAAAGTFSFTLNGDTVSFIAAASSTAQQIAEGLVAQARAYGHDVTITDPAAGVFTITANVAGQAFTAAAFTAPGSGAGTLAATTANVAAEDLSDALDAIEAAGDDSYGLAIENRDDAAILEAAEWIESRRRIFIAQSEDPRLKAGTPGNIADQLAALSRKRTHVCFNEDSRDYQDIVFLAEGLSFNLDTRRGTWEFLELAGVVPANRRQPPVTGGQIDNVVKGPASIYLTAGGRNIVEGSKMANGLFIDQVTTEDWTLSRIEAAVFSVLAGDRYGVDYDIGGAAAVEGALRSVGTIGVQANHYAAGSVTVVIPDTATVSPAERAARCLRRVQFNYREAGSLHCVQAEINIES